MTDDLDDLDSEETSKSPFYDVSEVEKIALSVRDANPDSKWTFDQRLDLGKCHWTPPAVSETREDILYVSLQGEIPSYVTERIRLAKEQGIKIYIALTIEALFIPVFLELLADTDAQVYVIDDRDEMRQFKPRHFMAAMADLQIPVESKTRSDLAKVVWEKMNAGSAHEKGRRFEAFVAYLLSQIEDLFVVERNYRTETQELDIVLQINNASNRVWWESGVPFILVEGKNTLEKTGQPVVTNLIGKLGTKRQRAYIGLLFSVGGFTEDAKLEELRYSQSKSCVVMLDSKDIRDFFESGEPGDFLEAKVRHAMLR